MSEVINPHDAFFKKILGKPELAADFLTQHLPAPQLAQLDLSTLAVQKDSFVDDSLRQHFGDLLYKVREKSGKEVYVYLLFEHKSYPDPDVAFQLLRYNVRIWETALAKKEVRLPIISVVVYHGQATWSIPLNFAATFAWDEKKNALPSFLQSYQPEFSYHLVDLSSLSDDQIRGTVWLRVFQLLLKHIFDPTLGRRLYDILGLVRELIDKPTAIEMLSTFLRYVGQAGTGVNKHEIEQTVTQLFAKEGGALMKTAYEEWLQEGEVIGIQKGEVIGIQKGEVIGIQKGEVIGIQKGEVIGIQKGEVIGIQKGEVIGIQKGILQAQRQTIVQILQHRFTPSNETISLIIAQLAQVETADTLRNLTNASLQVFDLQSFIHQLESALMSSKSVIRE